ncbi:MAG TPA: apolipoprotein N-acyltransferase [bacterium]
MSRERRITAAVRRLFLPVLSGIFFSLAFPSVDAGYLAWIALVPLLVSIANSSPRESFVLGYLSGFLGFAIILSWMRLFGIVPWLLLAAYLGLYIGAFAGLYRWLAGGRPIVRSVWLVPLVWTALEYVRSIGVFGFPWALLGVSQHAAIPVLQVARISGVYGISFLIALVNAALAAVVLTRRPAALIAPGLLVAAVAAWGLGAMPAPAQGSLRVATLQPNVPPPLKFDPHAASNNLALLRNLVGQAASAPTDLIIMPETALPSDIFGGRGLLPMLGAWARSARSTLIATSLEHGRSNIAVAVAPSGAAVDRYDKVRLVAFAESGIQPGLGHSPMSTPLGPLGVAICFESIFPEVSRDLVRDGAEVVVVITNDAWSDGTAGPLQHARFAPLRAVETGRWVIQASNSGLSEIVDPSGRIAASLPVGEPGVLRGRVTLLRTSTPYARWGDWFAQLMVVGAIAATLLRRDDLAAEVRRKEFRAAVVACLLPLLAAGSLLAIRSPWWSWVATLLGFVGIFALGRIGSPAGGAQMAWRGLVAATVLGAALVAALWTVVVIAFRANEIPMDITVPEWGWGLALRQLLIAAAIELWLRGQAFPALVSWKGVPVAIGATTLIGMVVQVGLPAEAIAWAMVTGLGFGLIRSRTRSALGLIVPHALGNVLIAFLTVVR